jgi:Protein of unknown function (DUF3455)
MCDQAWDESPSGRREAHDLLVVPVTLVSLVESSTLVILTVSLARPVPKRHSDWRSFMEIRIPRRRKTIGAALGLILATGVTMAVVPGTAHAGIENTPPAAPNDSEIRASVVSGQQIYKCTQQPDGSFAFTQANVAAQLDQGINHSFVSPGSGPPQWVAPDGSAVTGKLVSSTPNGDGNIPELDLTATQSGSSEGLLSNTVEVLRLNTVGGVSPPGPCDPNTNPTAAVPYTADYVFVQGE